MAPVEPELDGDDQALDLGAAGTAGLAIRLFGPVEVILDGRPMRKPRTRKGHWLLALLALSPGRDVERKQLAALLWPDSDDAMGLRSLRQSLHDLRLALGCESWRLSSSPRFVRLDITGAFVDVVEFRRLSSLGDFDSLRQAIQLYRGSFLESCYEPWCVEHQLAFEQIYLCALKALADEAARRGDHEAAISYLKAAIRANRYSEELHRELIRTLAAAGRYAEATLAYRSVQGLFAQELAVPLSPETNELFEGLRARLSDSRVQRLSKQNSAVGFPASFSPGDLWLPSPISDIVGRDVEIEAVQSLLQRTRLVVLTGVGGVGKTRLALEVAWKLRVRRNGEGPVCWADLAPVHEAAGLTARILEAIGAPAADRDGTLSSVRRFIAGRELLLVLENCEHLLAHCTEASLELLGGCPNLRILATSRQAFGVPGGISFEVPPLGLPDLAAMQDYCCTGREDELAHQFSALSLFITRARECNPDFDPKGADFLVVGEICRNLDGLPLAIELAAARLRSLSLEEIRAQLDLGLSLLKNCNAGDKRSSTLEATFARSWERLSGAEREVLARLSVFSGGCTLQAVEAVCEGVDLEGEAVLDLVSKLVDKSWVKFDPSTLNRIEGSAPKTSMPRRYRLLETVRKFAYARLTEMEAVRDTRAAHCEFFLRWAESVRSDLWGPDQGYYFRCLEADHDNFRAALRFCREVQDVERELRLAVALSRFWDTCGHHHEGYAILQDVLSRVDETVPEDLFAMGHYVAGWAAHILPSDALAEEHWLRALDSFRKQGNLRYIAAIQNFRAATACNGGKFEIAAALYEESLDIYSKLDDSSFDPSILNNAAELDLSLGRNESARARLVECLAKCEQKQMLQLQGITYGNLSIVERRSGSPNLAMQNALKSLALFHDLAALVNIRNALVHVALAGVALEQHEWAVRLLGADQALGNRTGVLLLPLYAVERDCGLNEASVALGSERFQVAFDEGLALSTDDAVQLALEASRFLSSC